MVSSGHKITAFSLFVFCLSVNIINVFSFKFPAKSFSFKVKQSCRGMASENQSSGEKAGPKKPNSNVDMFAAGERKVVKPPVNVAPTSVATKTVPETKISVDLLEPAQNNVEKVISSSVVDSAISAASALSSTPAPSSSRNSMIELQAELLRLEAEKEQLEIDQLRLDEEKFRLENLDAVILQLIDGNLSLEQLISTKRALVRKELFFRLAELANSGSTPEEKTIFTTLCDDLMETVNKIDGNLHAELSADIQKELNLELNRTKAVTKSKDNDGLKSFDDALTQWQQQIAGNSNRSSIQKWPVGNMPVLLPGMNGTMPDGSGRAMIRFPAAVPINLLPLMMRSPEISTEDLTVLKEKVFTQDIIGNVVVDYSTFLATFRGQPNVSTTETFERAKARMAEIPGMSERLRLFMLPEYRLQGMDPKNEQLEKYSGSKFEPVFTVLSKQAAPKDKAGNTELAFGFTCLLATLATCFIFGTDVNSLNEGFVAKAMLAAAGSADGETVTVEALAAGKEVVSRLLPVAFGILGLQVAHDIGHAAAAKAHDTKISLPYFLPSLQVGIFGSITNFLEFPKSRKALFDIAIAGPAVGFLVSLGATLYGLTLTAGASLEALAAFPALPTGFFSSSFLLHELVNNFLPITASVPAPALTAVHPLVAVGMTGLLANALNFMPIGRLDGGRVAMAVAGRAAADQIAFITLIGQAVSIFSDASPIYFFWIVLVVFLQRGADIPPEDDVTPVATEAEDQKKGPTWIARALTLGFCLSLTGAMILPVPQQVPPVTAVAPTQAPIFAPARAPIPTSQETNMLQRLNALEKSTSADA